MCLCYVLLIFHSRSIHSVLHCSDQSANSSADCQKHHWTTVRTTSSWLRGDTYVSLFQCYTVLRDVCVDRRDIWCSMFEYVCGEAMDWSTLSALCKYTADSRFSNNSTLSSKLSFLPQYFLERGCQFSISHLHFNGLDTDPFCSRQVKSFVDPMKRFSV